MRDALGAFGCPANAWHTLERDPSQVRAFIELHIEQGPVLLNAGLPAGVVSAIAGSSRVMVHLRGRAGHAGTVPMGDTRRDALAAAAEMILAAEAVAQEWPTPIVCTVGKIDIGGGAINVIPGRASFSIDLRSGDNAARCRALEALRVRCAAIADRRRVVIDWQPLLDLSAAPCDPKLMSLLEQAVVDEGIAVLTLASGAGHDAMSFRERLPIAMLFIRCGNGGISHHPDETVEASDVDVGVRILSRFVAAIDQEASSHSAILA